MSPVACYHCGEPCPDDDPYAVELMGAPRSMCCPGCAGAAELIRDAGLTDFYRFRTAEPPKVAVDAMDSARWTAFDHPEVLARYAQGEDDGLRIMLTVGGMRCGACAWLIERRLTGLPGIHHLAVNLSSGQLDLGFEPQRTPLSEVLAALAALGYQPRPALPGDALAQLDQERRDALKRIAVAGLAMMQVMTYAVGSYFGAFRDMSPEFLSFFRNLSLILTTPVVLYSARPFFANAWRGLLARSPGMDLPVSLAVGGAYLASLSNTFRGTGEVYFDSVTMFVFLLTMGRTIELGARKRALGWTAMAAERPALARRVSVGGVDRAEGEVLVPADTLQSDDAVRLLAGDLVPADGVLTDGELATDERLLTGESEPVTHAPGDELVAGARCVVGPGLMRVTRVGERTVLAGIRRRVAQAQAERSGIARIADRIAGWFVLGVLLLAAIGAGVWWGEGPDRAFEIALAILVVTCPCALSLATPTTLAAASSRLAGSGLMPVRPEAIERMARIDTLAVDKTGTLTRGEPTLNEILPVGELSAEQAAAWAAALERSSQHPIAAAFRSADRGLPASDVSEHAGAGIEGVVEGRWLRLGRADWVGAGDASPPPGRGTWVALSADRELIAWFSLSDPLRPGAAELVQALGEDGIATHLLSGDAAPAVAEVATALGIREHASALRPEDKLQALRVLQDRGQRVAMLGDGINDGPVLAAADLGIAMGSGAAIAQTSADMIIPGSGLRPLIEGRRIARRAMGILRANLAWAVAYNLIALPLAFGGLLQPWMAALGMSFSSLVVVLNASRLAR